MSLPKKIAEPEYGKDIAYDLRFRNGNVIENYQECERCLWCNDPVYSCKVVKTDWYFKSMYGVKQKIWHQDCLTNAINNQPRPAPKSESLVRFCWHQ